MKIRLALALVVLPLLSLPSAAAANVRELNQDEIRGVVGNGQSLDLARLLASVGKSVQGELVSVRTFLAGKVYYQVTVLRSDGALVMIIVDGLTGELLPVNSEQAKAIRAAAKAGKSNNAGGVGVGSNGNNGNNGNNGGNGNGGNGNGGGNGRP